MQLSLKVKGEDGYVMTGASNISRGPADIVGQMTGPYHQYSDGAVLFLGTLANRMTTSDKAAPWTYGASHLMRNLAKRGLL